MLLMGTSIGFERGSYSTISTGDRTQNLTQFLSDDNDYLIKANNTFTTDDDYTQKLRQALGDVHDFLDNVKHIPTTDDCTQKFRQVLGRSNDYLNNIESALHLDEDLEGFSGTLTDLMGQIEDSKYHVDREIREHSCRDGNSNELCEELLVWEMVIQYLALKCEVKAQIMSVREVIESIHKILDERMLTQA